MYTITLADGTKIDNLELNGNNFVSQLEIIENTFVGNLDIVTISDGKTEKVMHNAELVQIAHYADGWYFILREIPENERAAMRVESQVIYTAMMTDTMLPEVD